MVNRRNIRLDWYDTFYAAQQYTSRRWFQVFAKFYLLISHQLRGPIEFANKIFSYIRKTIVITPSRYFGY